MSIHAVAPGDRNVFWLPHCQQDLRFKPIKYLCSLNASVLAESTPPDTEINYIDIGSVNSNGTWTAAEPMIFGEAPSRARRIIEDGDVLISTVRTYLRAIAHIEKVNGILICSTGFAVLSAGKAVDPRFMAYWVRSKFFVDEVVSRSVGVSYPAINAADIGNLPLPVLSLPEQHAIAAFLDKKTAIIDALIATKKQFIDLLQEKRVALISRAVTKGLYSDMQMKDSGVEWIGEVPIHWNVMKIKRLCLVKRGASPRPIDDPIYFDDEGEYAWVRISDVTASSKYLTTTEQRLSEIGKSKSVPLEPGELFLSIAATVGKPIITTIKCCIHDGFVYFVNLKQNRDYLFYLFSGGELYKGLGKFGTQLNLNTDTIGDIRIPIPPSEEQSAIASFLDYKTEKIDILISEVNLAIERLKEYRTALITAAVTRKIDVRQEAP